MAIVNIFFEYYVRTFGSKAWEIRFDMVRSVGRNKMNFEDSPLK